MKTKPTAKAPPLPPAPTGPLKLTTIRSDLNTALKMAAVAVSTRGTLPVLGHVLLKADSESQTLTLSATNLEIGLTVRLGARVAAGGALTAPFKTFSDLVTSLEAPTVDLLADVRTMSLKVTGGRTASTLKGLDSSEFPEFTAKPSACFTLPASAFKQLVRRSTFSAATDEARPVLTGISFGLKDGRLTLAASDGFRLAVASHAVDAPDMEQPVVVPARALDQFIRFISDNETVAVGFVAQAGQSPTQLSLQCGALTLVCQLLEGTFPDYETFIPTTPPLACRINCAAFVRALKLARIFSRDSALTARLKFTPDALFVSGVSADSGDGQSILTSDDGYTYPGDILELGINCDYLAELVSAADTEQVSIGLKSNQSPLLISPVGANGYRGVLMPMMLGK